VPPKPRWLKNVAKIRAAVEGAGVGFFDRSAVESLFGLRPRQANKLMAKFPTYLLGNGFVVPREAMVDFLEATERGRPYRAEQLRVAHVRDVVLEAQRELAARRVRFAVPPSVGFGDLPDTIRLSPGQLTVEFTDAKDLLQQLFRLSKAAAKDFDAFERLMEPGVRP
jgi:hypothetical protein